MMKTRRRRLVTAFGVIATAGASLRPVRAQAPPAASSADGDTQRTFAVEIRTGPGWDARKPPQEQAQFREHSAHLRRLRDAGHIVLGARYSDKGLLVVAAADVAAVRALFEADPSMQAGTFVFEVHPLAVFYGGCVQPPARRAAS
jgi:uncharacterized protein YciI